MKLALDWEEITRGDAALVGGRPLEAVEHHRNAWNHAAHLLIRVTGRASERGTVLEFLAFPGQAFAVEASTNLAEWATVGRITAGADGLARFDDAAANQCRSRFYRVRLLP